MCFRPRSQMSFFLATHPALNRSPSIANLGHAGTLLWHIPFWTCTIRNSEKNTLFVCITDCMHVCVGRKHQTLERAVAHAVLLTKMEGKQMLQQDQWQTHPSNANMPGRNYAPNMGADDSSTFVKPLHDGSSQSFSPYAYSPGTAIPPPPPDIDSPRASQPKRNPGYQIAITVLTLLVVVLVSLEVVQLATHTLFPTFPSGSAGSN